MAATKSYAAYHDMPVLLRDSKPFVGNSMSAFADPDGTYFVYSYRTCIAIYDPNDGPGGTVYYNESYYSPTTSHHQHLVRAYVGDYAKQHATVVTDGPPFNVYRSYN